MHGRSSDNNQLLITRRRPISFDSIQQKQPDRAYFIKDNFRRLNRFVSQAITDLYQSLWMTFSFDQIDFNVSDVLQPIAASGIAYLLGEVATTQLSRMYADNDEYAFVFKFLLGSAILGISANHRITEHRFETCPAFSLAVTSEVLAICYLYSSTYRGSRMLLDDHLSNNTSLVASLAASAFVIPGAVSYMVQKFQEKSIAYQYSKGAQRSDTALISSGLTQVGNTYFLANHFLITEMLPVSRMFQLGLISYNILYGHIPLQQFRNFPALLADAGPQIVKKLFAQFDKIENDYKNNTTKQKVLKFTPDGPKPDDIERYRLRKGDLVYCDDKQFDLNSVPVSGEVVSLKRDEKKQLTLQQQNKKFSINLVAHNGENTWIERETLADKKLEFKPISLHDIRDKRQPAVLAGSKLNLFGDKDFFVRINAEKEKILNSNYEKSAVINHIINKHKQRCVTHSIVSSIIMSAILNRNHIHEFPVSFVKLLFDLNQMQIPFSEAFLREMSNSHQMNEINTLLKENRMETIDALRIVDFINALGNYYKDKFPMGVAIVSDKTGTLTTTKMQMLGLWTADMKSDVQALLQNQDALLPDAKKQSECFEVFASAFTNSTKELEPEEFAILDYFQHLSKNNELKITLKDNNVFEKTLFVDNPKTIKTYQLGLYRKLGGRLTLVEDGNDKYLVFCGIPRADLAFKDSPLLNSYNSMLSRKGVLSRDWCVARTQLTEEHFNKFKEHFDHQDEKNIEEYACSSQVLKQMVHHCTFIVDNPVKKAAEKFISNCKDISVPVFIATGDNVKAAENIAKVLCSDSTKEIVTIRPSDVGLYQGRDFSRDTTLIFAGINDDILACFDEIMKRKVEQRPVIIFAEMSPEGKGILARYLRDKGYFVVANGDGTNDAAMMKNAGFVIAHLTDDGKYAPGISQFANLNDRQLQTLFHKQDSFYELFDIHLKNQSQFKHLFEPLANTQEKPSYALMMKIIKMSFELAAAIGLPGVKEMWQQHWFSVAFDLTWLWISYNEIKATSDYPVDKQHLNQSNLPAYLMASTAGLSALISGINYYTTRESTNGYWMLGILAAVALVQRSFYTGYGHVRDELHPAREESKSVQKRGFFSSCFRKRVQPVIENNDNKLALT